MRTLVLGLLLILSPVWAKTPHAWRRSLNTSTAVVPLRASNHLGMASWYNSEIVHNGVHDLQAAVGALNESLERHGGPEPLRQAVHELDGAVERIHDELEAIDEATVPVAHGVQVTRMVTAFRPIQARIDRFQLTLRSHQVAGNPDAHLTHAFAIIDGYARLKFWMTPVP